MQSLINKSIKILEKGGVIIYPSDTIWAIGCDATNQVAIDKIFDIKKRDYSMPLICLIDSIKMLEKYVYVNDFVKSFLRSNLIPTTIIYDQIKNLSTFKKSVGIRIPDDSFCQELIKRFGKPITSTSVNFTGKKYPSCFDEIDSEILKMVDYVVKINLDKKISKASRIIKIENDNTIKTLRS